MVIFPDRGMKLSMTAHAEMRRQNGVNGVVNKVTAELLHQNYVAKGSKAEGRVISGSEITLLIQEA